MVYRSWLITWLLRMRQRVERGWHQVWQWLRWGGMRPVPPLTLTSAPPPVLPLWERWLQQLQHLLSRFPRLRAAPQAEQLPGAPDLTALPIVPVAPVLPEPTLEVDSVGAEYESHWLERLLQWLDRVLCAWERQLQDFWHWLRGFFLG